MLRHWKLALALVVAGLLLWGLRTGTTPNTLYPILSSKANTETSSPSTGRGIEIRGRVIWKGEKPVVPPMRRPMSPYYPLPDSMTPNPLSPVVSPANGLADVFLVLDGPGVESIPKIFPPVKVEWKGYDCEVIQGNRRGRFGLVRSGDEVEFVALDAQSHSARARGADFFTLMLSTINRPVKRVLNQTGMVEITSGTWFYWAQARLWVSPHEGCAITDAEGNFTLSNVPPGQYTLSAIRANWNVTGLEGDPEFPVPVRAKFAPPVVLKQTITVGKEPGETIRFEMNNDLFTKPGN